LRAFSEERVHKKRSICYIRLQENQLDTLDVRAMLPLRNSLIKLNLSRNRLSSVPAEIDELHNLVWLDLSANLLEELPASVGSLVKLRSLSVASNRLASLPVSIAALTSLQQLNLHDNRLTQLPPCIVQLASLCELYANRNSLTFVPDLRALKSLRVLQIAVNPFQYPEWGNSHQKLLCLVPARLTDLCLSQLVQCQRQWPEVRGKLPVELREHVSQHTYICAQCSRRFVIGPVEDGFALRQFHATVQFLGYLLPMILVCCSMQCAVRIESASSTLGVLQQSYYECTVS